jgi:hypothetical protein
MITHIKLLFSSFLAIRIISFEVRLYSQQQLCHFSKKPLYFAVKYDFKFFGSRLSKYD